jgi:hypothetical protein
MHACIHTHTYIHSYIHSYIHTHIHTHTTHTYMHAYIHSFIHTYIHSYTHHTHTHIHTYVASKGFWRWCATISVTGFLNLTSSIARYCERTRRFGNWICFRSQVKSNRCSSDWGYIFLRNPTECVLRIFSPEDGNRFSFRNVVFFSENETMDILHEYSNTDQIYCNCIWLWTS